MRATRNLALPNAEHRPAEGAQSPTRLAIATHVACELRCPDGLVAPIHRRPAPMTMPEATVHENENALGRENEVWLAEHPNVTTPTVDALKP